MIEGTTKLKDISISNDLTKELLLQLSDRFGLYHYGVTNMFAHQTQVRNNDINDTQSHNYFIVYASAHQFYYDYKFGFNEKFMIDIDGEKTVDDLYKLIGEFICKSKTLKMHEELTNISKDFNDRQVI